MSKKLIKFFFTTMGLAILIMCITQEVDGIGRAAMIISGTTFVYAGLLVKDKN